MTPQSPTGLTLLEVIVCILILMLLSAFVIPSFSKVRADDRRAHLAQHHSHDIFKSGITRFKNGWFLQGNQSWKEPHPPQLLRSNSNDF